MFNYQYIDDSTLHRLTEAKLTTESYFQIFVHEVKLILL
jgi:hypothetical protein